MKNFTELKKDSTLIGGKGSKWVKCNKCGSSMIIKKDAKNIKCTVCG